MDFIFGRNICVFDSCRLIVRRNGGTVTAGSTDASSLYGYVFRNCILASIDSLGYDGVAVSSFYLGRPWQNSPRTVYMHCYEPATLAAVAWTTMQVNPTLYAECNCFGPGFITSRGTVSSWPPANQARQLTSSEAVMYSLSNIFSKNSAVSSLIAYDWMPVNAGPQDDMPITVSVGEDRRAGGIPEEYALRQNYPNPFNPSTTISFNLPKTGFISLKVFDLLGREVATLMDGYRKPGMYQEQFDASHLAGGVYVVRLKNEVISKSIKLLLIK